MRFHVVKRDNCPLWKKLCLYVLAVAAALGLGALVLLALGVEKRIPGPRTPKVPQKSTPRKKKRK